MSNTTWYTLQGVNPEPWEATKTSAGRKGGKTYVQHYKSAQVKAYYEAVKSAFPEQNPHAHMHPGPTAVTFYFWRNVAHKDMGSKKTSAGYADVTNLQKALEDCLQGLVYKNDKANLDVRSVIVEQGPEVEPFVFIGISDLEVDIDGLNAAKQRILRRDQPTERTAERLTEEEVQRVF